MKWEYKSIALAAKGFMGGKVDMNQLDSSLNDLGKQDWELVSMFDTNMGHGQTRDVIAVFKRPR